MPPKPDRIQPERNFSGPLHHEVPHNQHPTRKSTPEVLTKHRDDIREHEEEIRAAWKKSCQKGSHDSLIFESFLRTKYIGLLNTLQAIKRLGDHKKWESVLRYVFGEDFLSPQTPTETTGAPTPSTQPNKTPPTPQKIVTAVQPAPVKPNTPPQPAPTIVNEPPDYETLALEILENQQWMAFLRPLCQLHSDRKYRDFVEQW
jgi:hypothetical protein